MFNVIHVSFSKSGGAGVVANRLYQEQKKRRLYNVEFLSVLKRDLLHEFLSDPLLALCAFVDQSVIKKQNFVPLISLHRDRLEKIEIKNKIHSHKGILHFHWINGIIRLDSHYLFSEDKKIIWTMHDMNGFTGVCHHSLSCEEYLRDCAQCPAVKRSHRIMVENNLRRKQKFLLENNLTCVFPSKWLEDKFRNVKIFSNVKTQVIKNPIPHVFFDHKRQNLRSDYNIQSDDIVIGFVSTRLNNPLKNYDLAFRATMELALLSKKRIYLLTVGESGKDIPENKNLKVIHLGPIFIEEELIKFYDSIDINLSTSIAETFALTVAEAASRGVMSLVNRDGAATDIIKEGITGFSFYDQRDLVNKLLLLVENNLLRRTISKNAEQAALNDFAIDKVINAYEKIYET